ncbi:MAG: FecCD family ABC transporter permease, partial [Acidobacteriota bacterium]
AVLGSVVGLISGMAGNWLATQLFAFMGAIVAIVIVYQVAKTGGRINTMKLILAGVIVSAFFSGITMFLFSTASGSTITNILFWMMGDLSTQPLGTIWRIAPFVLGIMVLLYLLSGELNLVMVSEENALQLGVNVERVKKGAFVLASLLTGAVVSVSGAIGFIGLIVPNMVRLLWGADLRSNLPLTALSGAGFLVLSDTLARIVLYPTELPVGVVTAAFGAPFFIYLLKQKVG